VDGLDTGDTAWMLASTALVLLMTPGLAFFYGGMVRSKSVLNMMMMSLSAMGLVGILWALYGYSMAFGNDVGGGLLGNPFEAWGLKGLFVGSYTGDAISYPLSGTIGRPLHFNGHYWCDYASDPSAPMSWRYKGGPGSGALSDIGSHVIDLAEFVCGPIESVRASGDPTRWVELTCAHAGGATSQASLSGSVALPRASTVVELFGPTGDRHQAVLPAFAGICAA